MLLKPIYIDKLHFICEPCSTQIELFNHSEKLKGRPCVVVAPQGLPLPRLTSLGYNFGGQTLKDAIENGIGEKTMADIF